MRIRAVITAGILLALHGNVWAEGMKLERRLHPGHEDVVEAFDVAVSVVRPTAGN